MDNQEIRHSSHQSAPTNAQDSSSITNAWTMCASPSLNPMPPPLRDTDRLLLMLPHEGAFNSRRHTPQEPRWEARATNADRHENGRFINDGLCHVSAIPPSDPRYDRALLLRFADKLGYKVAKRTR
jgi:hypothetical protein